MTKYLVCLMYVMEIFKDTIFSPTKIKVNRDIGQGIYVPFPIIQMTHTKPVKFHTKLNENVLLTQGT